MKIRYLSVKDLIDEENKKKARDERLVENRKDLAEYLKIVCSEKAFTIRSLSKYLRNKKLDFVNAFSSTKLKYVLRNIIIEASGDSYTTRKLHGGWRERKRWFSRFYYFHPEHLEQETQEKVSKKTW